MALLYHHTQELHLLAKEPAFDKVDLEIYLPQELQYHPHMLQMLLLVIAKDDDVVDVHEAANA